ncbi:MAG TPA: MFS transporter [Phenylobacterium sp.]
MAVAEDLARVPQSAAPAVGELKPPWIVKFLYSFGQTIESGYIGVATYIFFYYTAVLGLSGSLVGLALAISMAVDAVFDPLIGSLSDNVRSKFGRRLPVMIVGAPLMALSTGLLFAPPTALAPFATFLWLVVMKIAIRAFASMFNLPYFALGAEMATGYVERSSIVAYRTFGGIALGVVLTILALSFVFAGPGGLQRLENYPVFGWTCAALFLGAAAICCLGVWRYAASLPQPLTPARPLLRALAPEVIEIFKNRSFRTLFFSALLAYVAAGLNGALNTHLAVFVWRVRSEDLQTITFAFLAGITAGVPLTPVLLRFMEKRSVVLVGLAMVVVCWSTLPSLRAAGLFMLTGTAVVPWLAVNIAFGGAGIGFLAIAYPSMMADATDEHEVKFGTRREGMYFAGLGFAAKAAAGGGALLGGIAIDLLHFPKEAGRHVGAILPEDVLAGLAIAWGPVAGFIAAVSALMLIPYAITRRRHDDIAAALKIKRAEDVAAGRSS